MPTKNKCSCKVKINNHSSRTRCCNGNVYGNFGGKNFCFVHAQKILSDKAIYIQKIQRGRRSRQLLENIYKKVPCEIQGLISEFMKQEYYFERSCKTFFRILTNKIDHISAIIHKLFYNAEENDMFTSPDGTNNIYFYLISKLVNVLNICLKNWKLVSECQLPWIENYLMKFYFMSCHKIWGITIWNGNNLTGIFDYLENNIHMLEPNKKILENYYTRMHSYKNIFTWTFKYIRFNCHHAEIENRLTGDNHIFLNIEEND